MRPKDSDGMANSVDPDQTAQVCLSENLGTLRYTFFFRECFYVNLLLKILSVRPSFVFFCAAYVSYLAIYPPLELIFPSYTL